jgi:hypothetical protein
VHYQWTISAGKGNALDQPSFEAVMPSPPVSVTVTVTVDDGTDCQAFGTLTFTPLSQEEFLIVELFCRLRNLAISAEVSRKAIEGVREGDRLFVDPLWDPVREALRAPLASSNLRAMHQSVKQLLEVSEKLIDLRKT